MSGFTETRDPFSLLRLGRSPRLPALRQTEAAECGLVCLAMVAHAHGLQTDIATLRRKFAVSTRGMTLASLARAAQGLGLATRAVRLELEDLGHLKTPAILHWNFKHFVVLKAVTGDSAVLHDPAIGVRKVRHAELSQNFTGVALELWPTDQFKPRDERQTHSWRDLVGTPRGFGGFVANLLAVGFCLELLSVVLPVLSQWAIDHVAAAGNLNLLALLAISMGLVIVLQTVFEAARGWTIVHASINFSLRWRTAVFDHLLRLPVDYFQKRRMGDISSRFDSAETIVGTLNNNLIESLIDGVMSVLLLAIMLVYSPLLTAITVAGTGLYTLVRLFRSGPMRRLTRERVVAGAREASQFMETVRGIRVVKLFTREGGRQQEWLASAVDEANAVAALGKFRIIFKALSSLLGGAEQVLVFWVAMGMVVHHALTIGAVVAFTAYRGQFYKRVSSLVDNWMDLRMVEVHAQRLGDIVLTETEPGSAPGQLERVGELPGTIECLGLRYRYSDFDPYVLDGVDLAIREGESVAIVGPSGCGKSTLLTLLVGLAQPSEGEIQVGGIPMSTLSTDVVRRHVACVMQDDTLFAGTVAENIAAFDGDLDIELATECAKKARLHEDIMRMPMGYNSLVGDLGGTLSGGQRQRLCIARALYRQPRILIMDEATSHLDVPTEREVNEAIKSLGITRVIVAHRPETIRTADRIVVLEGGRVTSDPLVMSHAGTAVAVAPPAEAQRRLLGVDH